jgi:hypothetical protein
MIRHGHHNIYLATGTEPPAALGRELLDNALSLFDGDLACCAMKVRTGALCPAAALCAPAALALALRFGAPMPCACH